MSAQTEPMLRVLHAVRTLGHANATRISERAVLSVHQAERRLSDAESSGWITWSSFDGQSGGWSMTERGRLHGERMLREELAANAARPHVEAAYREFLPLNDHVVSSCSAWQLAELGLGEPVDIAEIVSRLGEAAESLRELELMLASVLMRFAGYHARFAHALDHVAVDMKWITAMDRDSCHRVWFELHEDLIATLGLSR